MQTKPDAPLANLAQYTAPIKPPELKVVYDSSFAKWVEKRLRQTDQWRDGSAEFGQNISAGAVNGTTVVIGVVYFNYTEGSGGNSIEGALVVDDAKRLTRKVLRDLFAYPFEIADCIRLSVFVRADNKKSIKLNERLGFKFEGYHQLGFDGRIDCVSMAMLRDDCKWLKGY